MFLLVSQYYSSEELAEDARGVLYGIYISQIGLCIVAACFLWYGSKGFRRKNNNVDWDNPDDRNTTLTRRHGTIYLGLGFVILIFALIFLPHLAEQPIWESHSK